LLRKSGDYDIIHCFGLYLFTPPAVLMKYILGKRAIGRVEGSGAFGDFNRIKQLTCGRFLLASARRLDRIIAIARHLVEEIASAGFPRQRIVPIPNSVDHEHYRPGTDRNRLKKRICFVGRLAKEKGLFCLVDAMQKVSDAIQGTTLTLVGDGPLRPSLAGRVVDLGLQDVVYFNGNGEALPHYRVSDLFVLPSFSEGLSLSLLEALACGLPVIATNVQGNSEVLAPHASAPVIPASGYQVVEYGILVNPGDVEGLAFAIQRLLTDTHLAHQFTSRVRSYVRGNYALEKIIDDYNALYRSLQ
jgi:glycosyltransferase involved in cell wall biosynthesis